MCPKIEHRIAAEHCGSASGTRDAFGALLGQQAIAEPTPCASSTNCLLESIQQLLVDCEDKGSMLQQSGRARVHVCDVSDDCLEEPAAMKRER